MFSGAEDEHNPQKYNIKLTEEELKTINDLIESINQASIISKKKQYGQHKPRLSVLITGMGNCFLIGDGERKDKDERYILDKNAYLNRGAFGRAKIVAHLDGEKGKLNISNKLFVVKIIHRNADDAAFEAAFFKKANGYAELVTGNGKAYIIEDFIPGVAYCDISFSKSAPISDCIRIIIAGLKEMARLHQLNINHGDCGGANIKYDRKTDTSRFVDFGLSFEADEDKSFNDKDLILVVLTNLFSRYIRTRDQMGHVVISIPMP